MTGNIDVTTALSLFKISLGITHDKRDEYFTALLTASVADLSGRGVVLDLANIDDVMLLVDYAEYKYRSRDEAKAMPLHLDLRIRNRKARGRAYGA